jgi:hypothetical protein
VTTLDEILGAFEEALELERELGTRTVECDRALLMPVKPEPPKPATRNFETSNPETSKPETSKPETSKPEPRNLETSKPATPQPSELKDFAFIVDKRPEGEAAEMMRNMLRAMGCSNRDSMVKEAAAAAAERPHARVYIVLGREAFQVFAPGQRAALGMWTKVADVPAVVTYSPAKILACFGSEGEGITKAKRQIWNDLKSALAILGRAPVTVKR